MVEEKKRLNMYLERVLKAIQKIEFHTRNLDISSLEQHQHNLMHVLCSLFIFEKQHSRYPKNSLNLRCYGPKGWLA